MQEVDVSK